MIAHAKKFIFVHINKNGGTSIEKVLRKFSREDNETFHKHEMMHNIPETDGLSFTNQDNILNQLNHGIDNYFKFTFVRNPWDRCVSNYFFNKKKYPDSDHAKMNFEDYLDDLDSHWTTSYNQIDWLLDDSGKNCMDFIGRFENFQEDFKKVCITLGIKNYKLPHVNKSPHRDYRTYYDEDALNKVKRFYKRDVEYFHYEF